MSDVIQLCRDLMVVPAIGGGGGGGGGCDVMFGVVTVFIGW